MRFGERFSYCDPQIPASAGVRPCVCFSVSLVEFSGRLLPVVLESLWNWRMAGLRSLCLRVVGNGTAFRGSSGVAWSSASFEDTVLGVVGRVWICFFLVICLLNEVGWGRVLRYSGLLRAVWGKTQLL